MASVSWRFASSPVSTTLAIGVAVAARLEFAGLDTHRQRLLLFHREQRHASDLLEIHPNGIVEREPVGNRLLDLFLALCLRLLVFLLVDELDAGGRNLFEELVELLRADLVQHVEGAVDLLVRQRALRLAARDELLLQLLERRRRRRFRDRCSAFLACHCFRLHPLSLKFIVSVLPRALRTLPAALAETSWPPESRSSMRSDSSR